MSTLKVSEINELQRDSVFSFFRFLWLKSVYFQPPFHAVLLSFGLWHTWPYQQLASQTSYSSSSCLHIFLLTLTHPILNEYFFVLCNWSINWALLISWWWKMWPEDLLLNHLTASALRLSFVAIAVSGNGWYLLIGIWDCWRSGSVVSHQFTCRYICKILLLHYFLINMSVFSGSIVEPYKR